MSLPLLQGCAVAGRKGVRTPASMLAAPLLSMIPVRLKVEAVATAADELRIARTSESQPTAATLNFQNGRVWVEFQRYVQHLHPRSNQLNLNLRIQFHKTCYGKFFG